MNVIKSVLAALLLTAVLLCWAQTSAPKDSRPSPPAGKDWKLVWQGKFEHSFGHCVARCKMPSQPGHWPAFWIMGSGVGEVGDEGRDGTEIDIVGIPIPWRDGKEVWRSKSGGVCQVPQYLKLTEEIGKWGVDIGHAQLPDFFEVDYVRVYDLTSK